VTRPKIPQALAGVLDFLGDTGSRWGLPAQACRIHGYLYLVVKPVRETELRERLDLNGKIVADALAWLSDYRLIVPAGPGAWRTDADPWQLMMRALEQRQRREIGPALQILRDCQRGALADRDCNRVVGVQIGKLVDLVEDLAAINSQAQRLSPTTLRQAIGLGALASRFIDRTLGRKARS
jgi:DNA-binding transcriptional regulator GbsR (MarR family)